jgi:hypothetical protein
MPDHIETLLARGPVHRGDVDDAAEAAARVVAQKARHLHHVRGIRAKRQLAESHAMAGDRGRQGLGNGRA